MRQLHKNFQMIEKTREMPEIERQTLMNDIARALKIRPEVSFVYVHGSFVRGGRFRVLAQNGAFGAGFTAALIQKARFGFKKKINVSVLPLGHGRKVSCLPCSRWCRP